MCQIETKVFAITYNGGSYQGTQNIEPIAVGTLRDKTKVLICRNPLTRELKCLDWAKVSNPRRVSRSPIAIHRPDEYLAKLATIEQEGIPTGWESFTRLPSERIIGYDPETRVVDTLPYSFALYQ